MSYQDDISIDKYNMEEECVKHPSTHFEYGKMHAEALRERRLVELEEEEIFAEVAEKVREQMAGQKPTPTETSIKQMVIQDSQYKKVRRKVIEAAHEVNVLAAALHALEDKTRMLGALKDMQLSHWQAEPRASTKAREQGEAQVRGSQIAALKGAVPKKK